MIKLPVDFEEKVRNPPAANGRGYPYRISARDLMLNFRALAGEAEEGEGGGFLSELPFAARFNSETGVMHVNAGWYQEGAEGEWIGIPATPATVGTHAYLVLKQNSDGSLKGGADAPAIVIGNQLTPILVLAGEAPFHVTEARVLIAAYSRQVRHGNFTIGLHQISGSVTRWPDTVVGGI